MKKSVTGLLLALQLMFSSACSKDEAGQVKVDPTVESLEILGADVSNLPELRESGMVLSNANNQPEDALLTLKKAGVNVIRLKLWKNPATPTSNLATVKALSQEAKQMGMKVMLTVHYSDTWAHPGQQGKPAQWSNIDFEQLKDSVRQYTKKIVAEIDPAYIQIGNEINTGLLFPEGNIANLSQMKALLQQGILSVRQTNPKTKIILHYAGHDAANAFFSKLSDLDYDIIGISYYPLWHGKNLLTLQQNLKLLASYQKKPVFIAETSYPFTFSWNDWTNNLLGEQNQILHEFEATPKGQLAYLSKIKEIVAETPGSIGFCYWGAEWVSYKGHEAINGSTWENQAFWDFDNIALPVLDAYK